MEDKIPALQQSQLYSDIAKKAKLPIATIRKALKTYEEVAKHELLNGKEVPLPGGMGYIYLTLTTSKSRTTHLDLTNTDVTIGPKLRTISNFSKPWKAYIQGDLRAKDLIIKLIKNNQE